MRYKLSLAGEPLEQYASAKIAEEINNISKDKVSACCRGERKTAGGYKWKLASDENVVNEKFN